MRRLAALVAAVVLAACQPPPPIIPPAPVVTPWIATVKAECIDELGGIHYSYIATATGHWAFQYLIQGHWSTSQQIYPAVRGDRRTVVTTLPFRLVWFQTLNGVVQPPRVVSGQFYNRTAIAC